MGQNMGTLGGSKSGSFEVGKKVGILHLDRIGGIFLSWGKKCSRFYLNYQQQQRMTVESY